MVNFDSPIIVNMVNLNLGGVYFRSVFDFEVQDQVMLNFLNGEMELLSEVLRAQKTPDGDSVDGYGCRFLNITHGQEERLARYIFECQLAEREKNREKKEGLF